MTEDEFANLIRRSIADNPEWLNTALLASSAGAAESLARERERSSRKDAATLAALALLGSSRVTRSARDVLVPTIRRGIGEDVDRARLALAERRFMDDTDHDQ